MSSSSSSSSFCCTNPTCYGGSCAHFSSWAFVGMSQRNSDDCTLYVLFDNFAGSIQQVSVYRDSALTELVAIGQNTVGTISLATRNNSGLSGTVIWDGVLVTYPTPTIVRCAPLSSSSSSESLSSSSLVMSTSSSDSSYSTSSSSSVCCTNPDCIGSSCNHFSAWTFAGMNDHNSDACKLYAGFDKFGGQQQVQIYKDSDHTQLVAVGQGAVGVIALSARNSSGLSGTVIWDGISVYYTSTLILDCDASSSSSSNSNSSSSSSSESSSSITSFSSGSSSSSSRSTASTSSSSSTENVYSSSSTSSSSESVGNTSSSSSSFPTLWNRIKPVLLGMASVDTLLIKNKLAQTILVKADTYSIGKVYCYFFGPYGYSKAFTVHMDIYSCTDDGIPSAILSSQTIAGASITGEGWYHFDFNITGATTPANGYLSFVMWQENGDEDNCVMWGYLDSSSPVGMTAWFTNDEITWNQHDGIVRALKVVSIFDAYDLTNSQIVSPPASEETVSPSVSDGSAVMDGVEVIGGQAEIKYPDSLTAIVVDSSGSMGWNDRFSTRQEFIDRYISRLQANYPGTNLFDMVSFGALMLNFSSIFSGIGKVATINLDVRIPTRTTYVFSVSGASATAGAVYTNGTISFTVLETISSGNRLICSGSEDPIPAGNLFKASGTGDDPIAFASFSKASVDSQIVAYGFKNMELKHSYNIGEVSIDENTLDGVSVSNWNAFNNGQAFTISIGNNGPNSTQSVDFTDRGGSVVRKTLGSFSYQTAQLLQAVVEGDTQVKASNVGITSVGGQVDIIGRNYASTGHDVSAIDTTTSLLTISPSARFNTDTWAVDNGIVQQSNINDSVQINGSTLRLLVRDTGVSDNAVVTFFLQTFDGYAIEWDFKPHKKWYSNNLYWLDETAHLPVRLYDIDGTPFPDGTKVVFYVDKIPEDSDLTDQTPSSFLVLDAGIGDVKVYLRSTEDFLRGMQVDIVDKVFAVQRTTVAEVGVENGLGYLKFDDALDYDFTVANESRVVSYKTPSVEIGRDEEAAVEANRLSPSIAVVDATPIYAGRNMDPDLLKKYDPVPVSPSTTWDQLNLDKDRIRINIEDAPTIDGYVLLRVLPITEDNLKTIQAKNDESARLLRLGGIQSVTNQSDQNSLEIQQYLANATTTTTTTYITMGEDYVISNPVYSFNGLATGTMTTTATNMDEYTLEGLNTAGFGSEENQVILAKQYNVYPAVVVESQNGTLIAQQFVDTFDVYFTPPIDIYSIYDGDTVPYYVPTKDDCGTVIGYARVDTPGPYATGNGFTIDYTVTNKGILSNNGSLRIRIYTNKYINQDEFNYQVAKSLPTFSPANMEAIENWRDNYRDKKLNVIYPPKTEVVNGQTVTAQQVSDINKWRFAVENNPIVNETNPVAAELHQTPGFDVIIDPLTYFGFYTPSATDSSTGATADESPSVDTKKWGWTWATQYEAYDLEIPINVDGKSPGRATLHVPDSDVMSLLLIQASMSFGGSNKFEAVTTNLVFVANPIGVKELLPLSLYPTGGTTKYAVGANITWRGDPIDINTLVNFLPSTTPVSGTAKVVNDTGWSQGAQIGPHDPVQMQANADPTKSICPPGKNENVSVGVSYGGYETVVPYKTITWSGPEKTSPQPPPDPFGMHTININSDAVISSDGNASIWADGTIPLWQIDLLGDPLNALPSYVNRYHSDGIQRLMGAGQPPNAEFPNGAPATIGCRSCTASIDRWFSPGKAIFTVQGSNFNIGNGGTGLQGECPGAPLEGYPFGVEVGIGTGYQFVDPVTNMPDSRAGVGLTLPPPASDEFQGCWFKPIVYFREPLAISLSLESDHPTYLRDGIDSPLVIADVTWKGKPVTSKFTAIDGTVTDFPFPYVTFKAGTCGQKNRVYVPGIPVGHWEIIDRRGGMEDCLVVDDNDDVILDSYRVQVGLYRTSVYSLISGGDHTHACTVDSDGNGSTTTTINLTGEIDPHTHVISNYVVAPSSVHPSTHTLRSVAITQLKPTRNISVDVAITGQVRYDPTHCELMPGDFSDPEGNRMMFKSMYLSNPSQRNLLLVMGVGRNNEYLSDFNRRKALQDCEQDPTPQDSCGDEMESPRLYTSMTVTDTPKAFNILAYARYSAYTDQSGFLVPEQPVPDGTRINFQIDAYKAVPPGDSSVSSLVIRRDATKKYMILKVTASTTDDTSATATFEMLVEIMSVFQWLPGIKALVSEPNSDALYLSNAVSQIRTIGASQINDAVLLAAQRITQYQTDNPAWKSAKKSVLLLTDGDENTSENSIDQAINNVNFVDGNCEVPIIAVRMGASYNSDDVLLRRYSTETCGQYNYLVNADIPVIEEVIDDVVSNGQASATNYGTYTNTIDMGGSNIFRQFDLGDVSLPTDTRMLFRVRHSPDQINWSTWSEIKDSAASLTFDMSLDSRDRYLQYEVFFYGSPTFDTPSFKGVTLGYLKPQSVTTFFQPVSLNINSDEYLASIHITHTANIPATSTITYGYSQVNSTDIRDYSSVTRPLLTPDRHTVILTRFNEIFLTSDYKTYTAINGGWSDLSQFEIRRITQSGKLSIVSQSDCIVNSRDGTVTFSNIQDRTDLLTLCVYFDPVFRITCNINNYGDSAATVDHIGILYNVAKRIPTDINGNILYTPIAKRIT